MKVYIMGEMGEKFGSEWTMNVPRIKDIFNLIGCQRKGFKQYVIDQTQQGVNYTIQRGEEFIGEEELELSLSDKDIIITPVPAGAGAVGKIVLGAILLVTVGWALIGFAGAGGAGGLALGAAGGFGAKLGAVLTTGFGSTAALSTAGLAVAGLGLSLVMMGIQEMLMPEPSKDSVEQDSYLFGGGVNSARQGMPVPVVYGQVEVAGKPISVSYVTQKPTSAGWQYTSPHKTEFTFNIPNVSGIG